MPTVVLDLDSENLPPRITARRRYDHARRVFQARNPHPFAGPSGGGANVVLRRGVCARVGPFDEAPDGGARAAAV